MEENKQKLWACIFLFLLMMSLFLFYREPGFFQHDMVEYAMYADYVILDDYDALYYPYFANLDTGAFPWRTGTMYLTVASFWAFHFFGVGSEFATFFVQFSLGSLAVVLLYLFLVTLYNEQFPAIIGALVFGLSTPLFNAVLSKEQGAEFFFAFAAMYLLLLGIKKRNIFFFVISNISLGLLLCTKESSLFFPIIYYGFFFLHGFSGAGKLFDRELFSFNIIIAITIPYFLLSLLAFKMYVWLLLTTVLQTTDVPFFTYTDEIVKSFFEFYPLLFLFFVFFGVYFAIKNKAKEAFFFLGVIFLFFLAFTRNSSYDIRHLGIYIFFPLSLLLCYGLSCLWLQLSSWKKSLVIVLALLLCVQLFLPGVSLFQERKEHIYTEEFAEGIATVVPEDGVVFVQKDFCLFVAYYAERECQGMPTDFSGFEEILASGRRVFVFYEAGFGFYDDATKTAIEEQYLLSSVYSGKFETFHHADLKPQVYDELLIELSEKPT